jgi:hypothetical protein
MSGTPDSQLSSLPADVTLQAQAEAERFFGAGPIADWHAPAPPACSSRWPLWLAAASGLAAAALVIGPGGWARDDDRVPAASALGDPADDLIDTPPAAQLPTLPVEKTSQALASPTLNITRRGAEWRIEALGVSRLEAAQRLAQASGSPLLGDTASLAAARPLHLSWQGRSAAGAWQAVLGPEVSFATQCSAARCRVWILDQSTTEQGRASAMPTQFVATPMPAVPVSVTVAVNVAAAAPQSDSTDARIAAHHD